MLMADEIRKHAPAVAVKTVSPEEKARLKKRLLIHLGLAIMGMLIMGILFQILKISDIWSFPASTIGLGSKEAVDFLEDF